jgi:putative protein kinase ArgK-like GTPase of G3E family
MPSGHDEDWPRPPVLLVSAETQLGLDDLWSNIDKYRSIMMNNGHLAAKRRDQAHYWMWKNLKKLIEDRTRTNRELNEAAVQVQLQLDKGEITPRSAAMKPMNSLLQSTASRNPTNGSSILLQYNVVLYGSVDYLREFGDEELGVRP